MDGRCRGGPETCGREGRGRGWHDPRGQPHGWRWHPAYLHQSRRPTLPALRRWVWCWWRCWVWVWRRNLGCFQCRGARDGARRAEASCDGRNRLCRNHFKHSIGSRLCRAYPTSRSDILRPRPPPACGDGCGIRRGLWRIQCKLADRHNRPAARRHHARGRAANRRPNTPWLRLPTGISWSPRPSSSPSSARW